MNRKDVYEDLCRYYEMFFGTMSYRDRFKDALKLTIGETYLETFFQIPASENITLPKLRKKTSLQEAQLMDHLKLLAAEGFVLLYETDKELCCERGNPVFMTEQQVRKPEDTPRKGCSQNFSTPPSKGTLKGS